MPGLIPQDPDNVETPRQQEAWEALRRFEAPFLCAFADSDPITKGSDAVLLKNIPGTQGLSHPTIEGAAHFLQEDAGPRLAEVIAEFARGGFRS
jgi:haloalkane dehalogenase